MKKIILIYGDDEASKLAIKEINNIRNEYQNLISKHNIQILITQNNQLDEQDKFESVPAIRFINDEELLNFEGYNTENLNHYEDYFLDFLQLREQKPFVSWIWNKNNWKWEAPVSPKNSNIEWEWDETIQKWIPLYYAHLQKFNHRKYDSWSFNNEKDIWEPPISLPDYDHIYIWVEEKKTWILASIIHNKEISNEN